MDKDVLTLIALEHTNRNALRAWPGVISSGCRRVIRCVALCAAFILIASLVTADARGEIFRLPVTDSLPGSDFTDRAESARIPGEIATGAFNSQVGIPDYLDGNPLLPEMPEQDFYRVAQNLDRPEWAPPAVTPIFQPLGQQIRVRPRGGGTINFRMMRRGNENVIVVPTPTQFTILDESGPVELSADRIVVWTDKNVMGLGNLGDSQTPVEIYLEGNIEFRQGGTRGLAERMYYNVAEQNGVILEGEIFGEARQRSAVDIEDFRTPFRLKGEVLRQFSPTQFQANNAAFTTSLMGVPQYWIESDALSLDTGSTALLDQFSGGIDGQSQPFQPDRLRVTSENSQLFVGAIPIFRWPSFTTDLTQNPSLYLDQIRVGSDSVFGQQLLTRWNNFQLLGITPNENIDWTTTLDYLSDRGLGFGSDLEYQTSSIFGRPAIVSGFLHSWFINDRGTDNLGEDRRSVTPEADFRGRAQLQHRHLTPEGLEVTAEAGWTSDRNFREQFYEEEWDLNKDQDTRLEVKQYSGSSSLGISTQARVNDHLTQTEWLPRLDHFEMGRALLGNRLTWYEHSQIGYGRLRTAEAPTNSVDQLKFDPLAWEQDVEGVRAVSRQEIDMPMQLGAMKVVPYVLGEAAYWEEDLTKSDVTRLLGQAGVRTSLPWWRVDPTVRNELFNLNGLAHKLVLETDFLWADASEDYLNLPLYDNLDDDAIEFFRRRFLFDTFGLGAGANVPLKYDERTFAFRSGMQRNVAAPSAEIADDLMMFQVRLRQRIQTKRGLPGRQRTVDWFTFDVEGSFFPRSDRDNFGQEIGPATYDMAWHVGDRTTILSDGYFDFFGEGLRTVSLGLALSRPGRSQYYVAIRSIEGPISSNVLTSSMAYRLSKKWIWNYGSSVDFSGTGNIGQSAQIVRIGESLLVGIGAYYDASRDNLGIRFDIVPRFIRSKLGRIGGRPIPPVGAYGLE